MSCPLSVVLFPGRDPDWNEDEGFSTDGVTTFINAAVLNRSYELIFPPVIFDVPLPPGYSKTESDHEHKSTSVGKRKLADVLYCLKE